MLSLLGARIYFTKFAEWSFRKGSNTPSPYSPLPNWSVYGNFAARCGKVAENNLLYQKQKMQFAAIRHYWQTCGELIAKGSPQYCLFAKS